ncbi:MAG: hypothetical protein JXA60_09735 [Candidatus Coatesbacteria bacterium]|nr:hypothetical protein [Candidatus Coatesbacteria bacterium]
MDFNPFKLSQSGSQSQVNKVVLNLHNWFVSKKQDWEEEFKNYLSAERKEMLLDIPEDFVGEYKQASTFQKLPYVLYSQKIASLIKSGFIQVKSSAEQDQILSLLKDFPIILEKETATKFQSDYLPELAILAFRRGSGYLIQLLKYAKLQKEKERILFLDLAVVIGHLADHFDLEITYELTLLHRSFILLQDETKRNYKDVSTFIGLVEGNFIGFYDDSQGVYNTKFMEQASPLYHLLVTVVQINKKYLLNYFDYLESKKQRPKFASILSIYAEHYRKITNLIQNTLSPNQKRILNKITFDLINNLDLIGATEDTLREASSFIKLLLSKIDLFEPIYFVYITNYLSNIPNIQKSIPVLNKILNYLNKRETEALIVQNLINEIGENVAFLDAPQCELVLSKMPKEVEAALIQFQSLTFWNTLTEVFKLEDVLEEEGIEIFLHLIHYFEDIQDINKYLAQIYKILLENNRNGHLHIKILFDLEQVYSTLRDFTAETNIPPKIKTFEILIKIFDKIVYNDCISFLKHKGIERLVKSVLTSAEPVQSLTNLNQYLDNYQLVERRYLVEIYIILQSIFFGVSDADDLKTSLIYSIKIITLVPIENRFTFIQEDLSRLLRILVGPHLESRLILLIDTLKLLENRRFTPRFINKIVPVLFQHFGKEQDELKRSLQWAVDIYNKNGDESLIFSRLERKMVFQIETVGKRMSSVPRLITQITSRMGVRESQVEEFIKMLKAIALKFSKLEMMMPQQRIGSTRMVVSQGKSEDKNITEIIERFLRDGINKLVFILSKYQSVHDLFQDEGENTLMYYLDKVMPLDTITQEDMNVAFGSKPVLFEKRGLIFMNQLLPHTVVLLDGDHEKIINSLNLIIEQMERQYGMMDISSSWFPRFAPEIKQMNTNRLAKWQAQQLSKLHNTFVDAFHTIIEENYETDNIFRIFTTKLNHITTEEQHFYDLELALKGSIKKALGNIMIGENANNAISEFIHTVVHEVSNESYIRNLADNFTLKENYREWSKKFNDIEDVILFYSSLSKGDIPEKFNWMKSEAWYKSIIDEAWASKDGIKLFGSQKNKSEYFENLPRKRLLISQWFQKWTQQNLGPFGICFFELLSLGLQIEHVFGLMIKILAYGENYLLPQTEDELSIKVPAKVIFLRKLVKELPHIRTDLLRIPPTQRLKQFETSVYKMLIEKLEESAIQSRVADTLELLNLVPEQATISFFMSTIKTIPKPHYYSNMILFILYHIVSRELKKLIPIPDDIIQETNKIIGIAEYQDLYSHCGNLSERLSQIAISRGLVSQEIADKIQAEMAEKQKEDINLLSVLMEFTLDPDKIKLLALIEDNEDVMQLLQNDYNILLLVRQKSHHPELPNILASGVSNPKQLHARLQSL